VQLRRHSSTIAMGAVLALGLAACAEDDAQVEDPSVAIDDDAGDTGTDTADTGDDTAPTGDDDSLLDTVLDRGRLVCGVNDAVPGFGTQAEDGSFEGFDIDFCRVIAAGVLGDADAVDYVPLTAEARFTALQSGEIDVLSRNTTWTATRDGGEGAAFVAITFYDGQGMMVRADSGIGSVDEMDGTAVCVLSGTTTELNLESQFAARGLDYEPLTFEDNDTLQEAFTADRCDGWTSDKSQLAAIRSAWPEGPEALTVLDDTLSKEPLGPAVRDGDSRWFDAVNWSIIATIAAEEFELDSGNVTERAESVDPETEPEVARFLGVDGTDPGLGLPTDFAVQIVSQVGNYAEIFDRNVGPDTGLGLERGPNALWTEGGLHYPPPYR
jgi:general L-amino acid transport system substrate-binding protein